MSITKTKNNSYRVRKKYPVDVVQLLGLSNANYDKIFKTRKEAKQAELDFENRIQQLRDTQNISSFELGGEVLFKDFYKDTWLNDYKTGLTSSYPTVPSKVTISNTEDVFRLHILPMFGNYTLNHLNHNRKLVIQKMNAKAKEYANFKVIRSYVNQVFDLAEEYEYIEYNRLSKSLKKIKSIKKNHITENKRNEEKYLTESQLLEWFQTVKEDYDNEDLTFQDYVLFWTTYFLSDRKSETYALQWKHIDFSNNQIYLVQALDKFGNVKSTKGNKSTDLNLPAVLKQLLLEWKNVQKKELSQLKIKQTRDQFLFTYCDRKGNINKCVHTDFLNYRMKSIKRRHPNLEPCSPHKLRHTTATLAKLNGMSLESISEALTHSEVATTKTYINVNNVIKLTPADFTYNQLVKSNGGELVGNLVGISEKKDTHQLADVQNR
ncbi:tyrosine-type recombinase/integrase [Enterococcus plantarum]|uniref:tyrosine-type recombinase/integrase n=1 Tax=Enterococcus plantarum TaxID=1077675 RepID=UPI001A8DCF8A|nr:site-specific integrase [Enterococcus plantarum]MBO0421369.1 site-specific integrase [Enterococcus plantarum]